MNVQMQSEISLSEQYKKEKKKKARLKQRAKQEVCQMGQFSGQEGSILLIDPSI